ncbi:restriction endonuclease subunit S [Psychrobacter sp. NPDC064578]|uniref:restriction endonuclease subunit S n=1 Tax=Psychrobacter sp. NPDC064578 TaxID=3364493 RepID=UPI0038503FBD
MVQDKYSEYLDSELMWVREYPAHWSLTKVKYEAYVKARVGWHGLKTDDFTDVGPYLVTGSDFKSSVISWKDCYHCDLARYEQDPYIQLQNGDLLLTKDGTIGKIALVQGLGVDEKATLNSGVFVVRPLSNGFTTEFYFWLLESTVFKKFFDYFKTGSTIVHLYQDTFVNFSYASPPLIEQTQIAKFLDHETAQIDTLIEKQQTLIQLLKEKRQAVISHAVTKGLNPDAPMKDSGVEWLGEVPEHWEVKRIKHYGKIMGGFAFKSDDFIDSGYPVLKISNVSHLQLNFDDESFLPLSFVEKHLEYKVEENDLVFAMTRPIISGGIKVAKIPKLEAMPLVNQRVGFLKLKSELLADFILYSSLSSSFKAQFKNNMTITNQPNISGEGIESVALPMPPKNELVEIVDFLNNSETVFQNLSIKSEQQVELLKERRTALISAAVTGKIDVRGWRAADNKAS